MWKSLIGSLFAAALVMTSLVAATPNPDAIHDAALHKTFRFAGMDLRVEKIESVATADNRPIAVKTSIAQDSGYLIVTVSMQNPVATVDRCVPDIAIGFELKDGSQIDENTALGIYSSPSLTDPPSQLHPKQRSSIVYLISPWTGSAPTKMFFKLVGGCDGSNDGQRYTRFQLAPTDVTVLAPVP